MAEKRTSSAAMTARIPSVRPVMASLQCSLSGVGAIVCLTPDNLVFPGQHCIGPTRPAILVATMYAGEDAPIRTPSTAVRSRLHSKLIRTVSWPSGLWMGMSTSP